MNVFENLNQDEQQERMLKNVARIWEVIRQVVLDTKAAGLSEEQAAIEAAIVANMAAATAACLSGPNGVRLEDIVRIYTDSEVQMHKTLHKLQPVVNVPGTPNSQAN